MKNFIIAITAVMLCVAESLAHDVEIDGIYYNLYESDKVAEVTYKGDASYEYDEYSGSVTIPETITYNSQTYSVTSIGGSAFYSCSGLTSVNIPNSVTSIGGFAFYGCSGLTSVNIPNSVTSIGEYTFIGCSGLTSVTIPNSVTSIDRNAFSGCSGLTSVTIPTSVTSIGDWAFNNCSGLTSITIPNSVTDIGDNAFEDCSGLTSVTIPTSVTSIGSSAFSGCSGLTSVTIPNSVTDIGDNAFYDCSGLTSVTIPTSVTSIGNYAFSSTGIYNNNSNWDNGVLYIDNCLIEANSDVVKGSYTIKEGTRVISDCAFFYCSGLTSVTIPTSVTSIADEAFRGCNGLTSVTIPNSVTSIGDLAFSGCKGLTSVTIPNSVMSIDNNAFSGCNNLRTVYNCSSIDIVKGKSTNGYVAYYADEVINGCPVGDFIVNYEDEIIEYIGDTTVNKIEIPEFVTGIEPNVFASCANIDTIVWNAIDCADFTETTAPFNAQAAQIKSVIFGNNVEYIPAYLCSDMTLLMEVSIPSKVNSIGENTFKGCSRLKFITSYPPLVPLAKEDSFNSYSAYLYIPCDYYDYYYLDDVFGKFKEIKCISAEEVEGSEKVEIEVDSNNNATIKWPSTGNASSYEIVISKNGEVFCTLLFNENGQLTSIDFGNRSASVGFQFTVTGLDGASKYSYSIVAKDEKGNELESYNGTFTTNGYSEETAILETLADANITITCGTISADTDFTIYNTIGQNVTAKNGSLTPGVYVVKVGDNIAKVMVK